jgi:alpha-1,2-mannosyltransferase
MSLNGADCGLRALAHDAFGRNVERLARRRAWLVIGIAFVIVVGLAATFQVSRNIFGLDLRIYRDSVISTLRDHRPLYGTTHEEVALPFTYPPFALLWLSPLALLPVAIDAVIVMIAGFAVCALVYETVCGRLPLTTRLRIVIGLVIVAAMFTDPFRLTFGFGQVNFALFLLVFADVFWLSPRWRGIGVGIAAAIKLTPLVFLLYFLWRRQWRALAVSIATAALCTAAAELVIRGSFMDYITWMRAHSGDIGSPAYVSNQSLSGVVMRLWPGSDPQSWMWLAACAAVLGLCAAILPKLSDTEVLDQLMAFTTVALTGLLISPISWSHHWVVIVVVGVLAVLWPDRWVRGAAIALWVSDLFGFMWFAESPPAGIIHGWFGEIVVSNAVSWCALAFFIVLYLRLQKFNHLQALPAGNRQHQGAEGTS